MCIRLEITRLDPADPVRPDRPGERVTITLPDDFAELEDLNEILITLTRHPAFHLELLAATMRLFPTRQHHTDQPSCIPD